MLVRLYGSCFVVGLLLVVGCQAESLAPDSSMGVLDGAMSCPWASSVVDVYTSNQVRAAKRQACRTTVRLVSRGQNDAAEQEINKLLVSIYADYGICVGGVFGTQDLSSCRLTGGASVAPGAVVTFAQAACDLGAAFLPQSGDVDCVVPTEANLAEPTAPAPGDPGFDPTAETAGGWIAVGPVSEGSTIVLPNGEFAHQLVDLDTGITEVFVAMRENPPVSVLGLCPGVSDSDCVQNNYTTDMDNPDDPIGIGNGFGGLYTEVCEGNLDFADIPGRCAGGECGQAANAVDPPVGILSCTKGALDFAPSTWTVIDADIATRDVVCAVTSQSAAVSEGTLCRVQASGGAFLAGKECVTESTGQFTASCTIAAVPAADAATAIGASVQYTMIAEKQQGTGSHSGQTPFEMSQSDPTIGNEKVVTVQVIPQGQQ